MFIATAISHYYCRRHRHRRRRHSRAHRHTTIKYKSFVSNIRQRILHEKRKIPISDNDKLFTHRYMYSHVIIRVPVCCTYAPNTYSCHTAHTTRHASYTTRLSEVCSSALRSRGYGCNRPASQYYVHTYLYSVQIRVRVGNHYLR